MGLVVPLVKLPLYHTEQSHCPRKEELCGGETTSFKGVNCGQFIPGTKAEPKGPSEKEIVLMNHESCVQRVKDS